MQISLDYLRACFLLFAVSSVCGLDFRWELICVIHIFVCARFSALNRVNQYGNQIRTLFDKIKYPWVENISRYLHEPTQYTSFHFLYLLEKKLFKGHIYRNKNYHFFYFASKTALHWLYFRCSFLSSSHELCIFILRIPNNVNLTFPESNASEVEKKVWMRTYLRFFSMKKNAFLFHFPLVHSSTILDSGTMNEFPNLNSYFIQSTCVDSLTQLCQHEKKMKCINGTAKTFRSHKHIHHYYSNNYDCFV